MMMSYYFSEKFAQVTFFHKMFVSERVKF